METINISLPKELKIASEKLIEEGFFASFSDLVRSSLRKTIEVNKYDVWAKEAYEDYKMGKSFEIKNAKDIKNLIAKVKSA